MNRRPPRDPDRAVALSYDGRSVSRVVAKGEGELARRIVEIARRHHVPLHEDPELAAQLARLDLDQHIPEALYAPVAAVLAFLHHLDSEAQDPYHEPPAQAPSRDHDP